MRSNGIPVIRLFLILAAWAISSMLQSCATAVKKPVPPEDPLVGKILETRTRSLIPFSDLMDSLMGHEVIYLSEKHDNPMHHAIQNRIIQTLVEAGTSPALGFEFFAIHETPVLLSFVDSGGYPHNEKMAAMIEADLRRLLNWDRQSDQMWGYYFDLLTLARNHGLTAAGLDLPGPLKRRITRKGLSGITAIEKDQIFSTGFENPVYAGHMKAVFKAVHCGMGDDVMMDRLYDTWIARNDTMARSITRLADTAGGPVVVIMGSGHTEYGLGVIDRAASLNPALSQVNLALTEVHPQPTGIDTYVSPLDLKGFGPVPPADYIWFTHRVSDEDPCQAFKKSLHRMKQAGK